ncbi:MAG: (Fe-S)-binding protein [Acidobacteriota bacterium]
MTDLLPGGTMALLYAVFVPFIVAFLMGVHRLWRRLKLGEVFVAVAQETRSGPNSALRRMVSYALLQRGVLNRPYGWIHATILWGFLGLLLGDLLLFADRYPLSGFGVRLLEGGVMIVFQDALDLFGLAFLVGVMLALIRRLVWKPKHLRGSTEATLILLGLLFIGVSGFVVEGLRITLQPEALGLLPGGRLLGVLFANTGVTHQAVLTIYPIVWWAHAVAAFAFIAALPYTQLVHVMASSFHITASSSAPLGALSTPFDLKEVIATGSFDVKVGAGQFRDFDARDRLALLACTECGRCEEVCPAHASGSALSPTGLLRRLKPFSKDSASEAKDVFDGGVTHQEVWACTMCGACADQCPVLIRPVNHITQLRRELVVRNQVSRKGLTMLDNLSRALNPYGLPHADRNHLAGDLGVQTLRENADVELLYWIGCAATYDQRSREVSRAMARILKKAGVRFGILGAEERCSGDPARRLGEEGKFQELAFQNLETFDRYKVRKILTHCAHCYNTFKNEYPRFGGQFEVVHHAAFVRDLLSSRRIRLAHGVKDTVAVHDACYVGRMNGEIHAPRQILSAIDGLRREEMPRNRENSFCCGAGGARYWYESDVLSQERIGAIRVREANECGAETLVSECPFCLRSLEDGLRAARLDDRMKVRDVVELVAEALG